MVTSMLHYIIKAITIRSTAAVAQAEGWVFESQSRQTWVVKTDSDSSTGERSTMGVCHGSSEMTIINWCPCHSRCGTLKNPHCSMAMSAEHISKFAALHRQWWRLHMTNKQTKRSCIGHVNSWVSKTHEIHEQWWFHIKCFSCAL